MAVRSKQIPVTSYQALPIPVAVLMEWDFKLDGMETLLDACVELDEGTEEQLEAVRVLRRSLRLMIPLDNQPIIERDEVAPTEAELRSRLQAARKDARRTRS